MSIFENFNSDDFEQQEDTVGGFSYLDSNIYLATIKTMYVSTTDKGELAVNLVASIDGKDYYETFYITDGGKVYTLKENNKKVPRAQFTNVNDICLCVLGKPLSALDTEDRIYEVYDFDKKGRVKKAVPTIVDLMDTQVYLGIVHQIRDEMRQIDGKWVATGKSKESNKVMKVFNAETKRTANEIKVNLEEAAFFDKWLKRWKGKVMDTRSNKAKAGTAGAPTKQNKTADLDATAMTLFGD